MEKTPAACAMEWSIQLDKTLRSKKPGKSIDALKEIGSRLEWWNNESKPAVVAEYRMFGLIHGEDKLFLNSIFLRLMDTFRLGNKQIKNEVVKLFLRIKRRRKRDEEGIFSKGKLKNYLELLRRVKEVFDHGDVEERALAMMLFGCWAEFAKDSPDIRYIVLSSLVSGDVLEVKASLFAAGCFCELSDDFGNVFLEILITMLVSLEISRDIKLAGGRAFAKMWCSFSLADKAYKTGLKLLMASSEDDFSAVMLISLSRISFRWMPLIPTQLELLTMFLSEDRSLHMQATSLRCHLFILARGVWNFPSSAHTVQKLFGMLQRSEFPLTLQLEAFKILHKILPFNLSSIPCMEMPELFLKLLIVVENMLQSSIVSTRVLAVNVLADLSGKLFRIDILSCGTGSSLACQVISFALDRILFLLTPKEGVYQPDSAAELEIKSLLYLLFILVEKHSYLCCIVLKKVCLFIDKLMKMLEKVVDREETDLSNHELVKSKLMLYVSKVLVACLQNLEVTDAEIYQVLDALKLQAEHVSQCSYFGSYISVTYFLLLHLHASYIHLRHVAEELMSASRNSSLSCVESILQLDILTIDCAKTMLGRNSYWSSYKAGKIAACQGAWSTAAFIFEQLVKVIQSASCFIWLKSLAQFSTSENQIQLLFLFERSTSSCPSEINLAERGSIFLKINHDYMENLLIAHNALISSGELLAASDMGHMFRFQIWFLTLRGKFVKSVVDIMKLLDTISCIRDGPRPSGQLERSILLPCSTSSHRLGSLISTSTKISYQMKKLAQELDLLLMSFIGMDRQSVKIVSELALSCSLMAFSAGFAFLIPNLHSSKDFQIFKSENTEDSFHALLVEDLAGRLRHIDNDTRRNFQFLLKSFRNCKSLSFPWFRTQFSSTTYESRVLHKLCDDSIRGIATLQKKATQVQQDGDASFQIINDGSQLLLNVISKWMSISFRTPYHFFRVRPSVSSELFVMNEDGKNVDGISVLSGFNLSLSLCFQLKNMTSRLPGPLTKVYCILNCKTHSQITTEIGECKGQAHLSRQDQEIDDMVGLNEKLLRYVIGSVESNRGQAGDCCTVNEYVCFELNKRGQGFSTCLLDVSAFPVGSYRIKWHSGFIDSRGSYWSPLPLNAGPLFTIHYSLFTL